MRRPTVSLNDVQLSSIDSRIYINKVIETKPDMAVNATVRGNHIGQLITGKERRSIDVTVEIAILEPDIALHSAILQKVAGWAVNGGKLKVNYRSGQKLAVTCVALPDPGSITGWVQNKYAITFRAYAVPYWVNVTTDYVQNTTNSVYSLIVRGTERTPLRFMLTSQHPMYPVTNIKLTNTKTGDFMEFTGLNLESGDIFYMDYDDNGILYARASAGDMLSKRTRQSVDELMLTPGTASIRVYSDGAGTKRIFNRARWA